LADQHQLFAACRRIAALATLSENLRGEWQMRLPVSNAAFGIRWENSLYLDREPGRAAEEHIQGRDSVEDTWGLRALNRAAREVACAPCHKLTNFCGRNSYLMFRPLTNTRITQVSRLLEVEIQGVRYKSVSFGVEKRRAHQKW
jgi:hypothetical protein